MVTLRAHAVPAFGGKWRNSAHRVANQTGIEARECDSPHSRRAQREENLLTFAAWEIWTR
jgi:hypothetical protein